MKEEYDFLVEEALALKVKHFKNTYMYKLFIQSNLFSLYSVFIYGVFYYLNNLSNFKDNTLLKIIILFTEIAAILLICYACITEKSKKIIKILFFLYITLTALRKVFTYEFTSIKDLAVKIVFICIIHFCIIEIRKRIKELYIIAIGILSMIAIIFSTIIFNDVLLLAFLIYYIFMNSFNVSNFVSYVNKNIIISEEKSFFYMKYSYLLLSYILFINFVM